MTRNRNGHAEHHVVDDRASRVRQAAKVARLIATEMSLEGRALLDVGAGAGFMAHAWAREVGSAGRVHAVDVGDFRVECEGYAFALLDHGRIPHDDQSFDIVVSHHAIEHIEDRAEQRRHVEELLRVVKHDGIVLMAFPNRWRVVEAHFDLPFLSWLPRDLRSLYVRLARRGTRYDCNPLSHDDFEQLAHTVGADLAPKTLEVVRQRLGRLAPLALLSLPFYPWLPTYFFVLRRRGRDAV